MRIEHNMNGRSYSAPVDARPLTQNVIMTGYDIKVFEAYSNYAFKYDCIYDGDCLWLTTNDSDVGKWLAKYIIKSDTYEYFTFENGVNGNSGLPERCRHRYGVFDGKNVWLLPYRTNEVIRVDTSTGTMTGFSMENGVNGNTNLPEHQDWILQWGIFAEHYIWVGSGTYLIKIDPNTGAMTGCEISRSIGNGSAGAAYDGSYLWVSLGTMLCRIDLADMSVVEFLHPKYDGKNYLSSTFCACAGGYIWGGNYIHKTIFRFDPATEEFETFSTANGVNGNSDMVSGEQWDFQVYVYDGQCLWFGSLTNNFLVRLDIQTGTMKGIWIRGDSVGSWDNGKNNKVYGMAFDGNNIWLPPMHADKLIKISSDTTDLDTYTITESYASTEGTALQDSTSITVEEGDTYTKTASSIPGYTCVGHSIDGGVLQSGTTARIENVTAEHTVVFVYRKDDDSGTDPGDSRCCCCGSLKLELNIPISNNVKMLEELTKLVSAAKGCDNLDCC